MLKVFFSLLIDQNSINILFLFCLIDESVQTSFFYMELHLLPHSLKGIYSISLPPLWLSIVFRVFSNYG
jgi:hypothetical protein